MPVLAGIEISISYKLFPNGDGLDEISAHFPEKCLSSAMKGIECTWKGVISVITDLSCQ